MGSVWYKVQPSNSATLSLEVNGAGTANGANVQIWQWLPGLFAYL
jgi:hypothetical protein